jgi:hypothetical protein
MHRIGRALRHTVFSASTYLRQLHLLLGAALALAFGVVDLGVVGTLLGTGTSPTVVAAVGVVAALVLPALVGLLPAVRQVEGVAVASLLGVSFPDGPPGPATTWPQRRRASAWFLIHVTFGFLVGCALAIAVPLALIAMLTGFGGEKAWWLPVGAILLLISVAGCLVLGAAATAIAPRLLGPSAVDRVQALERRTARLSERTRLARELHDSVGHALSLVVVQAGAARRCATPIRVSSTEHWRRWRTRPASRSRISIRYSACCATRSPPPPVSIGRSPTSASSTCCAPRPDGPGSTCRRQ